MTENCNKEKKLLYKNIIRIVFFLVMMSFIYFINQNGNERINRITEAFKNNEVLLCDNKIVSKDKNYYFENKETRYITNGENMYLLNRCIIKE